MTAPTHTILSQILAGIWMLGSVSLLMDIPSEIIHSLLPVFMVTASGVSAFYVGPTEGVAETTVLIVKVFSGTLSDCLGRRRGIAMLGYALGALPKPFFALAPGVGAVLAACLADRIGKGIRGVPRDTLITDTTPPHLRGAAFGLRQSLDTVGAFLGPLTAISLMFLWTNDLRAASWVAVIPGIPSVLLLLAGVREPDTHIDAKRINPTKRANLVRLERPYWQVVTIGALFTLVCFSEAFLMLRFQQVGLPLYLAPLVLVAMNVVYSLSAYSFGKLSDRLRHTTLLVWGPGVLILAGLVLAVSTYWATTLVGAAMWDLRMGMTQGSPATTVADAAPEDLRGTAFGFFNLVSDLVLLMASALAGLLWGQLGAAFTFYAGAVLCVATIALIILARYGVRRLSSGEAAGAGRMRR